MAFVHRFAFTQKYVFLGGGARGVRYIYFLGLFVDDECLTTKLHATRCWMMNLIIIILNKNIVVFLNTIFTSNT